MSTGGEGARAVAAARRALRALERRADPLPAARAAAQFAEGLREISDDARDLRARLVADILDRDLMTRAELAVHLGVTPQRISQLRRAARRGSATRPRP